MQDWQWEVSDATRLDEFLQAYESCDLNDDERFVLMEIILQSFEDRGKALAIDPRWYRVLELIDRKIDLHAHSVWYWSAMETEDVNDQWVVSPYLRRILDKHFDRLQGP
jgi:hypothetical protein